MDICIVTYQYPPEVVSGFSRTAYHLVKYITKKGHKVTVITSSAKKRTKTINSRLKIIYLPRTQVHLRLFRRLLFVRRIKKFFKRQNLKRFDIIHFLDMYESYSIKDTPKTKIVVSVNDYYSFIRGFEIIRYPCSWRERIFRLFFNNYLTYMNRKYLKKADAVVCNSSYLLNIIKKETDAKDNRLYLIYKGIKTKFFKPSKTKNKYCSKRILFVGNNIARKGLIYLLDAFREIQNKYHNLRLDIVTKEDKKWFRRYIEKNKLKNVFVHHKSSQNNLLNLYQKANVFVLPSILENIAQSLMESLSTETPVVTTTVGSNKELIKNNVGILIKPKQKDELIKSINYIIENPSIAKKMGEAGRRMIKEHFSKERMEEKYLELYKKLVMA